MDWSIILGILGIAVSVIVGWASYRFADRRTRNQKYVTAKGIVLQELSKSLGEDSIPTPAIIQATMRSVLREAGDPKIEIDVDEVLDDLMRQVTADPFLDSERRRKLQKDIEQVRSEAHDTEALLSKDTRDASYGLSSVLPSAATLIGILTTIATTALMAGLLTDRFGRDLNQKTLKDLLQAPTGDDFLPIFLFALAAVLLFLVTRFLDEDFLKKLLARLRRKGK